MKQSPDHNSAENKLKASIKQSFKRLKIIRRALVHPRVPWHAKAVVGCVVLYVLSPIQIIPNFIPILGQMDDVLVLALGVKYLRRHVPQSVLDECESNSPKAHMAKMPLTHSLSDVAVVISDLPVLPFT